MTIYDFITQEKTSYLKPVDLEDGWSWGMKDHLRRSFLYKNSQFEEQNENRTLRPFKNIILAILNVQYRTEGFDVKDIELYVNDIKKHFKSFLVRKFHNVWALKNFIDTFIDQLVESYCDYGGVLVRKTSESRPEVIDLRTLAFCNQRNILAYPFAIRHSYSASQLRKMKKWGDTNYGATMDIEGLINLVRKEEKKEIEVFEVHGNMPVEWLKDNTDNSESEKDVPQIQVVSFYQDQNKQSVGVTLFKHREPELPFKFLARDEIKDRALGRGGIEELFEPQVWTNWDEVKVTEMLEAASKSLVITDDRTLAAKHPSGLKDMDNLELIEVGEGKTAKIMDTYPRNLTLFNDSLERWQQHAQLLGSANELTGEAPTSGTPFKLYEANLIEAKGTHKYRQGKIATFVDEIYRDWILPYIGKEITKGTKFLSELSADEMQQVMEDIAENVANRTRNEQVLNGEIPEDKELLKQDIQSRFVRGGNRKFIEILKDEMSDVPLDVMTNIAGKQKNLALLTDKVVGVVRQYLADPRIRQDPGMSKLLNIILESSGLSPIMFNPVSQIPMQAQPTPASTTQPLQQFSQIPQPA